MYTIDCRLTHKRAIRTACDRYELEPFNFSFIDSQMVYSEFANCNFLISLGAALISQSFSTGMMRDKVEMQY